MLVVVATLWLLLRGSPAPAQADLPRELHARAELFTRAWLAKDVPQMRRVTSTTHDRVLYSWFVHHPPPAGAAVDPDLSKIEVRVGKTAVGITSVNVRVTPKSGAAASELTQQWVEREGTWYFVPPAR
jgi:hypothetical protein